MLLAANLGNIIPIFSFTPKTKCQIRVSVIKPFRVLRILTCNFWWSNIINYKTRNKSNDKKKKYYE